MGRALYSAFWASREFGSSSSLPLINPTFRVRYGILTALPACLILTIFLFSVLADTRQGWSKKALFTFVSLLSLARLLNLTRSLEARQNYAQVITAVDRVYSYVEKNLIEASCSSFLIFCPMKIFVLGLRLSMAKHTWRGMRIFCPIKVRTSTSSLGGQRPLLF